MYVIRYTINSYCFQACRGLKIDKVEFDAMFFQDDPQLQSPDSDSDEVDAIPLSNNDGVIIPSYSDFVYAYSTYTGTMEALFSNDCSKYL